MIREKKQSEHLLDYLTREAGLNYLSDLCWYQKGCRCKLIDLLTKLPVGLASGQEWNDTLAYITGEQLELPAEDARNCLLAYLKNKK